MREPVGTHATERSLAYRSRVAPREKSSMTSSSADWSPDGKELAVVHVVNGRYRLEYPIGKVLFETEGS